MIYLTRKEVTNALQSCSIDEITSFKPRILDHAEAVAIATVSAYLKGDYDIDFELRPYKEFKFNTIYQDNDRIRLSNNTDNHTFETTWGIELIDNPFYHVITTPDPNDCFYSQFDPTEDADDELILVKKVNTCQPAKLQVPITTLIQGQEKYKTLDNDLYDPTCGIIPATDGIYNKMEIINYYNSIYTTIPGTPDTHIISQIDYSNLTLAQIEAFHNINFFDQYLLSNQDRDFNKDDRNVIINQIVLDILVYTLVQRTAPRQISTMIQQRYDDALNMLVKIQKGELVIGLKLYTGTLEWQNHMNVRWGTSISGLNQSY